MNWDAIQKDIDTCRICERQCVSHIRVPQGSKRHPPYTPLQPTKLYFVSVAPPWGGGYFWDETVRDALREGLFRALFCATGQKFTSPQAFRDAGFFLTPAVKCPSEHDGKDHAPATAAIKNCSAHLRKEMEFARAERVLALGRVPFRGVAEALEIRAVPTTLCQARLAPRYALLKNMRIPFAVTYFPGNNHHCLVAFIN